MDLNLGEVQGIANVIYPQVGAVVSGINVKLSLAQKAYFICHVRQGAEGTATVFSVRQSTGNAGSATGDNEKAITNNCRIWSNLNCDADSVLTARTAAKTYSMGIDQSRSKIAVIEVVPEENMDVANSFNCVVVDTTAGNAANLMSVVAVIVPRYAPLPNALAD